MFDKVAIIGDIDLVFGFKATGMKIFSPKNSEEARRILYSLEDEGIALCFMHESFLEPLSEELKDMKKKFCPVVVGFSDHRGITDYMERMMKDIAIKATGSDSFVKGRGKDEKR
ncbi:MAG: V-type ATP synthase subunit F [Candidatus Aminicenantaceae bacterium]